MVEMVFYFSKSSRHKFSQLYSEFSQKLHKNFEKKKNNF